MIISLCGDISYKNIMIDKFKDNYKDKLVICDYFNIKFNTIIRTESVKYKLINESRDLNSARIEYSKYVAKIVQLKINKLLDDNQDKIILLYGDEVLSRDFINTIFFDKSDIKILLLNEDNNFDDLKFDKELFDMVINNREDIDVRKLVKV